MAVCQSNYSGFKLKRLLLPYPLPLQGHVGIKRTVRWSFPRRSWGSGWHPCSTMSLRRRGLKVPLRGSTHIIKLKEYTNVLFVGLLYSSQKRSLTPTQVGLPSMMWSVLMQLLSTMISPMGCIGLKYPAVSVVLTWGIFLTMDLAQLANGTVQTLLRYLSSQQTRRTLEKAVVKPVLPKQAKLSCRTEQSLQKTVRIPHSLQGMFSKLPALLYPENV